jgi:hypothetical protein
LENLQTYTKVALTPHLHSTNETPQVKLVSCKSLKAKKHHMEAHQPASQPFTDTIVCNLLLFFPSRNNNFFFFSKKSISGDDSRWMMMSGDDVKRAQNSALDDRQMDEHFSKYCVNHRNDHVRRCVSLVAQLSLG